MIKVVNVKTLLIFSFLIWSISAISAIPTEEGLLRNLNNPNPTGKVVTLKMAVANDFVKIVFLMDKANTLSMLQVVFGDSQMQFSQIKDVKFFPDFPATIAKETSQEKALFYSTLLMLATNQSTGIEIFLDKNGVKIPKNTEMMNPEKMALLKEYRTYLAGSKGKGEQDSPLNPADPKDKANVITLFKSNTYQPSKNISLIKIDSHFYWKADWKNLTGVFTNEDRRFKKFIYKNSEADFSIEGYDYFSFNGLNEIPKFIEFKDNIGASLKIQIISEEVSSKRNFEEFKKKTLPKRENQFIPKFMY